MRHGRLVSLLLLLVIALCACEASPPTEGEPDGGSVADAGTGGDGGPLSSEATCEAVYGQQVCLGHLQPSALGAGIRDLNTTSGGQGVHFFCYPREAGRFNGRVLLHLVGTGDNPRLTSGFLRKACALGFAGLAPIYENENDARSTCGNDTGCYERMRREILYGQDLVPAPILVDPANSVMNRVASILDRMVAREAAFPAWAAIRADFTTRELSRFTLSGHSQGSGHALMLARDFAVERLVMFGGLTDRLSSGTPENARVQWIANWAASSPRTPGPRILAYNHEDDSIAVYGQVLDNLDAVGAGAESCTFQSLSPAYPATCRRVRSPAAGCGGFWAHASMVVRTFGSATHACAIPGQLSSNEATWEFLLTTPLP